MGLTQEWLDRTREERRARTFTYLKVRPRLEFPDGFSVSIQASHTHYCEPEDDVGPYTKVELGFPSTMVLKWQRFAEIRETPTGTVYPYVPIELVDEVIEAHGGLPPASD